MKAESEQARQLSEQFKNEEALPFVQDAVTQRPRNAFYRELLGKVLIGVAGLKAEPQKSALMEQARTELRNARALGDNSNFIQVILEKMGNDPIKPDASPSSTQSGTPAQAALQQAEALFNRGQLAEAIPFYEKALQLNPKFYEAALFAGDALFKQAKYDDAGIWFAKAVAIDPNRETAYRYWGDALQKAGKPKDAESKFIDGVIAEPYTRASWVGLQQWGQVNHVALSSPAIKLPASPTSNASGQNITINIAPGNADDPNSGAWMIYSLIRAGQMSGDKKGKDKKALPYRHSLDDEATALRAALGGAKDVSADKLDPNLRLLRDLDKDGMLEAWIVINHADQGTLQDYAAYREKHRNLLRAYLAKYVVHTT